MTIQNYNLGQGLTLDTVGVAVPCHLTEKVGVYVGGIFGVGSQVTLEVSPDGGSSWMEDDTLPITTPGYDTRFLVASQVRAKVAGGDGTTSIKVTLARSR